ncbi:hypothetical protein C0991_004133, partial [Blastosporella zonata]
MAQMKAAAKFVLHGTNTTILNTAYALQVPGMFIRRDNQPFGSSLSLPSRHIPVLPPVPEIKKEEYEQRIAEMDTKLEAVLASLQKLTSGNSNSIGRGKCAFCGRMGHTVHNCYEVERYINSGRVLRRDNCLCLPSGATLPNPTMPGLTLQNHFDNYHQVNPGQKAATTNLSSNMCPDEEQWSGIRDMANSMLYGISDADHSTMALQTNTSATAQVLEERISALQQEIQALQKKQAIFDRVKLPRVKPFSRLAPANTTVTLGQVDEVPMQRASGNPAPTLPTMAPTPPPPIHPFANSNPRPNPRYQGSMPDRRNDQGAYQNKAPIADRYQSKDIFDKCLGTPITLTMGKLCGVSVEIRNHFRESTSPKWLVNINEVTTLGSMPSEENLSAFISTDEASEIHK